MSCINCERPSTMHRAKPERGSCYNGMFMIFICRPTWKTNQLGLYYKLIHVIITLTLLHTTLFLFPSTLSTLSCWWGRPQALIHLKHFSKSFLGCGNEISRMPDNLSGYLSSALHVPHTHLRTMLSKLYHISQSSVRLFVMQEWRTNIYYAALNSANYVIGRKFISH